MNTDFARHCGTESSSAYPQSPCFLGDADFRQHDVRYPRKSALSVSSAFDNQDFMNNAG